MSYNYNYTKIPLLGYCRTESTFMTFDYTWEIANFWETYYIMFPVETTQPRDKSFYFRLEYYDDHKSIVLKVFSRISYKCICSVSVGNLGSDTSCITEKVIPSTYNDQETYLCDFLISTLLSEKDLYTPDGTFTIHFQCKWLSSVSENTMYTTISHLSQKLQINDMSDTPTSNSSKSDIFGNDISDVEVVTFLIDDKQLKIHKNLLCIKSEVFKKMLNTQMKESATGEIKITDITYNILKLFLCYIKFGYIPDIYIDNIETLSDLFLVADKYDVTDLKLLCEVRLMKLIHINNYKQFFNTTWIDNTIHLKDFIEKFIQIRSEDIRNLQVTEVMQEDSKSLIDFTECIKTDETDEILSCNTEIKISSLVNSLTY